MKEGRVDLVKLEILLEEEERMRKRKVESEGENKEKEEVIIKECE